MKMYKRECRMKTVIIHTSALTLYSVNHFLIFWNESVRNKNLYFLNCESEHWLVIVTDSVLTLFSELWLWVLNLCFIESWLKPLTLHFVNHYSWCRHFITSIVTQKRACMSWLVTPDCVLLLAVDILTSLSVSLCGSKLISSFTCLSIRWIHLKPLHETRPFSRRSVSALI